jgi:hypothetical protein
MGAKIRRRFALESGIYNYVPIHPAGRKRCRLIPLEDEEYYGDDEREVCAHKIMPVHSRRHECLVAREVLEANDIWEPPRQKQKLELTARQKEKAAFLAYPDPWATQTTDEEELESLNALLFTTDEEAYGVMPHLLESNTEAEGRSTDHQEKGGGEESCYELFKEAWYLQDIDPDDEITGCHGFLNLVFADSALDCNQGPLQEEIVVQPRA